MDDDHQKGEVKRLTFSRIVFCHNAVEHELLDIFRKTFPVLAVIISDEKRGFHQRLARKLQKQESSVVIDRVVPKLAKQDDSMPLLSLHDCIATTEPYVQVVERVLREEFLQVLEFDPPIKVKRITRAALARIFHALKFSRRQRRAM
ncbi:MAG: hypothetical protein ABJF10_12175, partial [Chthoniobacter sp.]|uniref:hypothetical protein n=1 Tax=Chthoniobacter sp. TaxID=2510640 RepID=UPI0032A48322